MHSLTANLAVAFAGSLPAQEQLPTNKQEKLLDGPDCFSRVWWRTR